MEGLRSIAARTRIRVAECENVQVSCRWLPDQFPSLPADLVVLSEILYYLGERDVESVSRA